MDTYESPTFLSITATPESEWDGDFLIIPTPAPKTPLLSHPGVKVGEVLLIETRSPTEGIVLRKLLVSLGPQEKITPESYRKAGRSTAVWLSQHDVENAGIQTIDIDPKNDLILIRAFCEGLFLGAFKFIRHKLKTKELVPNKVHLIHEDENSTFGLNLKKEISRLTGISKGVNISRAWSHEPPNIINPVTLAERAKVLASQNELKCSVLGEDELKKIGAGAILSVGLGSNSPSQMIILEYSGSESKKDEHPVVVIGKALTFDTGGYSLKTTTGIVDMKYDKCGGMTVMGIMQAVAALNLSIPVIGIIAAAENMISSDAYRPNDIITTLSGKTVEIISTDAEGRMVLCDSLTYAHTHFKPRAIIDFATLTGGVVIALGKVRAGLMSNNDTLAEELHLSGERTHERLWRMPLDDDYFELIKGDDSDLKNSSAVRQAHPIVGGIFLKQFVPDEIPWAHIDIAGTATSDTKGDHPKGATGFGVRLLIDYLEHLDWIMVG